SKRHCEAASYGNEIAQLLHECLAANFRRQRMSSSTWPCSALPSTLADRHHAIGGRSRVDDGAATRSLYEGTRQRSCMKLTRLTCGKSSIESALTASIRPNASSRARSRRKFES